MHEIKLLNTMQSYLQFVYYYAVEILFAKTRVLTIQKLQVRFSIKCRNQNFLELTTYNSYSGKKYSR